MRLSSYSSPNKTCALKGVFVTGDRRYAYREYKGYYSLTYLSQDINEVTVLGKKDRLNQAHKGIAPQ